MDVSTLCVVCKKLPTKPHSMLCGHIFCLSPCLIPANCNQDFVRCPLCRIETHISDLEPKSATQLPSADASTACSECGRLNLICKICQHCSEKICPVCTSLHQAQVYGLLTKKRSALQSGRAKLASLKGSLRKLKDQRTTRKQSLTTEIASVTDQLLSMSDCALEKAKLLVISTFSEQKTLLEKLGKDLIRLVNSHPCLKKTACDIQLKKDSVGLREFKLSASSHVDEVQQLQIAAQSLEVSGISTLTMAKKFETIHLQLQDFRLVTSTTVDLPAPRRAKSAKGGSFSHPFKKKTDWDVNLNRIFVGSLPDSTKECQLHEYFSRFGIVTDVFLLKGQKSRNCGFVNFRDMDSVKKVLANHPHLLNETQISVSLAKNKQPADSCDKTDAASILSENEEMEENPSQLAPRRSRTIFVGQLKPNVSEADLKDYFSKYGPVSGANLVKNKKTGESCGYAFVTFADEKAFENGVVEACHFLDGCRLNVRPYFCRDKTRGPSVQSDKTEAASVHTENKEVGEASSEHLPRQSKTIFVSQLKPKVSADDLKHYFSKYGSVSAVNLVKNKKTGESRGFAFVTFSDEKAFDNGVLNNCHFLDGCRIIVNSRKCRDKTRCASVQTQMKSKPDAGTTEAAKSRARSARRREGRGRKKQQTAAEKATSASATPSTPTFKGQESGHEPMVKLFNVLNTLTPNATKTTTATASTTTKSTLTSLNEYPYSALPVPKRVTPSTSNTTTTTTSATKTSNPTSGHVKSIGSRPSRLRTSLTSHVTTSAATSPTISSGNVRSSSSQASSPASFLTSSVTLSSAKPPAVSSGYVPSPSISSQVTTSAAKSSTVSSGYISPTYWSSQVATSVAKPSTVSSGYISPTYWSSQVATSVSKPSTVSSGYAPPSDLSSPVTTSAAKPSNVSSRKESAKNGCEIM